MASTGWLAMVTIILVGLFNSVMFPSIFRLGVEGLGPLTARVRVCWSGIVGGAIIPVAEGALADKIGIHHAFILPALCYIYIAFTASRAPSRRRCHLRLQLAPSQQPCFEVRQHGRTQQTGVRSRRGRNDVRLPAVNGWSFSGTVNP